MNNHKHYIVDSVQVGVPRTWSNKQSVSATFHNFESIPLNETVCSPPLKCLGNQWELKICKTPTWLQVFLWRRGAAVMSTTTPAETTVTKETKFSLHVGNQIQKGTFSSKPMDNSRVYHLMWTTNILQRDGSLQIIVSIQMETTPAVPLPTSTTKNESIWTPPPSLGKDLGKMLESGEHADVVFLVEGTRFPAHKSILMLRAKAFQEMFEEEYEHHEHEHEHEIPLMGVQASHFHVLLRFIYTDEVLPPPMWSFSKDAEPLLRLANRFGCIRLKLLVEAAMVSEVCANPDGCVANALLLADSLSCALLREKALEVFLTNPTLVMASPGWKSLSASADLLTELMEELVKVSWTPSDNETTISSENVRANGDPNPTTTHENIAMMKVSTLRAKLDEKGLDVDGTREMLVARLMGSMHRTT